MARLLWKVVAIGIPVLALISGAIFLGTMGGTKEKRGMDVGTSSGGGPAIPPIDASAPPQTEVATFALG
jgi:hypothetical protein